MDQPSDSALREEIFSLVRNYWKEYHKKPTFVPGTDYLSYAGRIYDEDELVHLVDASLDFWLTTGRYAKTFEDSFASFLGSQHCILTNSGSSANLLAISALTSPKLGERQLKQNDEVLTVACGFPTTVTPIIQNRCIPVFVDVDIGTYNVNTEAMCKAISPRTKAVILAHTLGNPFNVQEIKKICEENNLWLIEDNCDALGSKYNDTYTGTFGDIGTFSFYPAHHITMGEGGALITNNPELHRIICSMRDWGRDCWCASGQDNCCGQRFKWQLGTLPQGYDHKYIYSHLGYNLKVTEMQAAIGVAQLKKLPEFIKARKDNFQKLYVALAPYKEYFILPKSESESNPSWFGFPITLQDDTNFTRDEIVQYLERKKIGTRMLFAGNLTRHPCMEDVKYQISGKLENTDYIMNNMFWVGVYPGIDEIKLKYMVDTIISFLKGKK